MEILHKIVMGIALLSGIALIASVTMQTTKSQNFSAAMGGSEGGGRFRKGSKEEMLDRITKVSAVVWIVTCAINFMVWHGLNK